jgi:uncharacterized protein (DUF1501 family)
MPSNGFFNCEGRSVISRRGFLQASVILSFAALPDFSIGKEPGDTRLLTVLLRGGMDGLLVMPPIGEKRLESLRPNINPDDTLKLDKFFALHPALANVHGIFEKGEALLVHGTSIPYVGRSHFEGQNMMESGVMTPYSSPSGWMGRALDLQGFHSVAMSLPAPLILRSGERPASFYPTWMEAVPKGALKKIMPLWAADTTFASIGAEMEAEVTNYMSPMLQVGDKNSLSTLAIEAGNRLRDGSGPRMAVLDHVGFDTHANEPRDSNRLLKEVDDAIGAFREAIGDEVWKKTLVITVTEFGRTIAENGSLGTDHGYGTAVFVLGGRLKKGGIVSDWPGLGKKDMFEGRDLQATIDARSLYGAVMSNVLEMDPELIRRKVLEHDATDVFSSYL